MTASADDITALDATALSEAVHARRVSCREVMQAYLARIARFNPTYNAIVSLRPDDELLAEADACDAELARGASRGWLHGAPQAIKDLANAAGLRRLPMKSEPSATGSRPSASATAAPPLDPPADLVTS